MAIDLEGIATAYFDTERRRLGLPTRAEEAAAREERERAAALAASQLETADVGRQRTRMEIESMPAEADLRRRVQESVITRNEREPQERVPQPTGDAYLASLSPEQLAEYVRRKGLVAAATRDPNRGAAGGLSPAAESNILNRLTTQWDKANSTINELKHQRDLMRTGLAAARKGDMAAGSQAVLVTFQKILDPTSVVRESEYARSAAGLSLLSRIQGAADRLAQGGAGVPVSDLEAFANLADQFVQQATASSNVATIRGRIAATADRYGIPHDVIFGMEAAPAAPIVLPPGGGEPGATSAAETWIEVAPGIRKKVKK